MALIDKASLLMVPSTYEAGKLYNVLPSGNRAPDSTDQNSGYDQTRADFDFDRGSNAAATRVNADGLIEKYRENLLLQSNQFITTWAKVGAEPESSSIEDFNGGTDAWLLRETTANSDHYIRQSSSITSGIGTFSFHAKKKDYDFVQFGRSGDGGEYANFNISNGTIGNYSSSIIDTKIEDKGNGWYRCSVTYTFGAGAYVGIALIRSDVSSRYDSYAGDVTKGTYIMNAQLESGLVSTEYLESTSVTGKAGVLVDLPRINYDANGENGALLLEPSRQQLLQYSEYFGAWTDDWNTSLIANALKSPTGFEDAYKMSAGTSNARQARTLNVAANGNLVFSIYAKKGEYSVLQLTDAVDGNLYANFDLENGVFGNYNNCTPSIEDAGDGWYKCLIFWNTTQPSINKVRVSIAESKTQGRLVNFAGNGTDGLYIFGAQCEAGSYATSYIPNHGESGGVTRAADSCTGGGSAESINSVEGVAFVECSFLADDVGENRDFYISDGTNTNRIRIRFSSSDVVNFLVYNGSTQADINYTLPNPTNNNKIAVKWKANDFALWVNGTERGTDGSGTTFSTNTLDDVSFFTTYNQSQIFHSNVKQVALFNEALSDSELATLTTL